MPSVQTPQNPHPEVNLPDASAAQQAINVSAASPASPTPELNAMPTQPATPVPPPTQPPLAQDEKNVQ